MNPINKKLHFSYLQNAEGQYIDSLYQAYQKNPEGVDQSWQKFFEGMEFAQSLTTSLSKETFARAADAGMDASLVFKEFKVLELIQAYRQKGHMMANTNPILQIKRHQDLLNIENFNLEPSDLEQEFYAGHLLGIGKTQLKEIINRLHSLYCGDFSIEYDHIEDQKVFNWIQEKFESSPLHDYGFSIDKKKRILKKLNEATVFENFLHTKFIGQKRFSLEGGENAITAIDAAIIRGADFGVKEVIIGMAHRGRLNVLANIIGKTYEEIFSEFAGKTLAPGEGDGDVKYHLGHQSTVTTEEGHVVSLRLMPNPSHLEAVGPVVQGYTRAKAEISYKCDYLQVLPILIHGDAAVAGQGVVYETLQMSQLEGYTIGGTLHFIINNQIGFTTDEKEARSSRYCSSVGRVLDIPIFHVNGDNAEAVVYATELAIEFRQKFGRDIFIDMVCYRKHGHNESDEPRFTQPILYEIIRTHPNPREIYSDSLIKSAKIDRELAESTQKEFRKLLQDRFNMVKQNKTPYLEQKSDLEWKQLRKSVPEDFYDSPSTGVPKVTLAKIMGALGTLPPHIVPIQKAKKIIEDRVENFKNGKVDWALGELLAYGSLLLDGSYIRLSGQDAIRGTFSHRHISFFDEKTGESYCQINHVTEDQAVIRTYNSPLSEYAVLGFEYGYSLGRPLNLTIWEAQFGDFANGAQTVIDQFISSGESKWRTKSGIVLLLPHGYEGQGPEHSSAKPERILQLCAEFNIIVANCTTPKNFFHIIRRQISFEFRKPLVIMSPKSLLRHPQCVSSVEELVNGKFEEFIDDSFVLEAPKKVKRVLLCTGKIYYDLLKKQQEEERKDVAIIRLEQLHPIPFEKLDQMLEKYKKTAHFFWVQEEPKNMGQWNYILRKLDYYNLSFIGRKSSASPATGYLKLHLQEQEEIVQKAFDLEGQLGEK